MATISQEAKRVSEILGEVPSSFPGTLDYHINRRGYTNEKMEERTGISSRMIQDYLKDKDAKPTLQSVLALCIGLNLHPDFCYDLISKAGYNIMTGREEHIITAISLTTTTWKTFICGMRSSAMPVFRNNYPKTATK